MKGLSETMFIIVAVIVILIVALVILTIFGNTITRITPIAEARQNCQITAESTCASIGTLPITWGAPSENTDQGMVSCADLLPGCACSGQVLSC